MSTNLADLTACFHSTQSAVIQLSADIRAGAFAQSRSSQERIERMAEINNMRSTLHHLSQALEHTARALGQLSVEATVAPVSVEMSNDANGAPSASGGSTAGRTASPTWNHPPTSTHTTSTGATAGGGGVATQSTTTNTPTPSSSTSPSQSVPPAAAASTRREIMQPGFLNRANNASATTSGNSTSSDTSSNIFSNTSSITHLHTLQ